MTATYETAAADEANSGLFRGSDAEIAKDLASRDLRDVVKCEGEFWRYCGTHWTAIPSHKIYNLVRQYDGAPYGKNGTVRLSDARIKSIIAILSNVLADPDFFTEAAVGINCEAGFIAFDAGGTPTLQPHSRDHRQRHVMRGTWKPGTRSGERVRKCLQTNFKGDEDAEEKIDVLEEATGAATLGLAVHKQAKCIVLYGPTADNGKSTVLDCISAGVPKTAVVSVPPNKFRDDQFAILLAGKQLNVVAELGTASAIDPATFKGMITGDRITARDVYKSACTFVPIAQHIFACNQLPAFQGGMGNEIRRRLLPIEFKRTIPVEERSDRLERIPIDDPDAFLAFAVNGAARWLRQKKTFTIPASSEETLAEWVQDADVVAAWVETRVPPPTILRVVGDKPAETTSSECYADFLLWAETEGYERRNLPRKKTFTERVKPALRRKGYPYKHSGNFRGFVDLRLHPRTPEMAEAVDNGWSVGSFG